MADMKEQQKNVIRLKRRRAIAWIACFALLFGMLAMPMTPTMPRSQGEQWAWGSFCTGSGGSRVLATQISTGDQHIPAPQPHTIMQHCACCSGSLTMVAVPTGMGFGLFSLVEPVRFTTAVVVFHAPPRLQWPTLNPRASPRV